MIFTSFAIKISVGPRLVSPSMTNPAAETKSIGLLAFACGYGEQSRPTRSWKGFYFPSLAQRKPRLKSEVSIVLIPLNETE